ncbi:MAG: sigma-70 family RNA polymerase sigma factor [Gemmatimonadaceae bacterium]
MDDSEFAPTGDSVTELLRAWSTGDSAASDKLIPLVYGELHRQAQRYLRREVEGHTLQTTALVHEAYLRLVDQRTTRWESRAQFFGIAARLMRRILVDHARKHNAAKRGGSAIQVPLDERAPAQESDVDLVALDDALVRLALMDERQARVVELRYFTGLGINETAEALGISAATAKRDWVIARNWLKVELGGA